MNRGQSAIEFVMLVSFMLMVFFGFFIVIQGRIIDLTKKQDELFLKEANNIVLSEVKIAFSTAPDFQHTFVIPDKGTAVFDINITDEKEIVSKFGNLEYVNFFPFNVTGYLYGLSQNNTVYSLDGIVIFPNGSEYISGDFSGIFINVNPESCYIANNLSRCSDTSLISAKMLTLCRNIFSLC